MNLNRYINIFIFSWFLFLNVHAEIIQINLDDFNVQDMERALRTHGTIELVGPTIDELASYASQAMETSKEILARPIDELAHLVHQNFHGFQNVKEDSARKGQTRNQIAFHFKPYRDSRMPEGISDESLHNYYEHGMNVLHDLYNKIITKFGGEHRSIFTDDLQSVLTQRRYFANPIPGATGIPAHSDYGLLTLVTSDELGLEVKEGDTWIQASSEPSLRFYVNIGDWLLFQLKNKKFVAGIHRVPEVQKQRHSLALFLNPAYDEALVTPSGKLASYQQYLFSDKSPYLGE